MRRALDDWHAEANARTDVVDSFEKDAKWLSENKPDDEKRRVLFCFLSDPYQPLEGRLHITRKCLKIAQKYGIKVDVLTKGAYKRVSKDFDLMVSAQAHLGVTLSFIDDKKRKEWEPNAASVSERLRLLKEAHAKGIYTWVSMEPVIDPDEALKVIDAAHEFVDFWKVGKLNYNRVVENKVDWCAFRKDVIKRLKKYGLQYYIKRSLREYKLKANK
jgi:DNA repair photolyase